MTGDVRVGTVTISPEAFSLVEFDRDQLTAVVERLCSDIGVDADVRLEVDESTPLGQATVVSADPIVLHVESGALEDPKHIRQLSPSGASDVLGRLLLRVRDRRDPAFVAEVEPPADDELPYARSVAWDVYAIGRLVRLGHHHYDNRQRRLYHFRTRHGFSDEGDRIFERLWTADDLTWADIDRLSAEAEAAT